ncbi:uncharacterized protein LOC112684271 [Sipha flava]|uniref:Uncharacterized protein LOC112684271 n=1 Tax=Sipha flava TaxID=143950 RepID=A0A8B8FLW6_9HEMI|nr:uncharacterized protein LOC112684271 [Sipha flava]
MTSVCMAAEQVSPIGDDEDEIVPYVLPKMEENRAKELNTTYKLWVNRFARFSKFNDGIIADPATLYSGPPEVLAKLMASRCKSLGTVINPFCGSGAIAIQLVMVCRKVTRSKSRSPGIMLVCTGSKTESSSWWVTSLSMPTRCIGQTASSCHHQ